MYRKIKYLLLILFFGCSLLAHGQRQPGRPLLPGGVLNELNLTPQQREEMKLLIMEYRVGEIRRKRALRRRLAQLLDAEQRIRLRRWIRTHQAAY